jgi:hypothetical protein
MRNFLTVLTILALGFPAFTKEVLPPSRVDTSQLIQDDRFVPFPWSIQQPIPFASVEGTWLVRNGEFSSYYNFRQVDGMPRDYHIKQIDTLTCKTVAFGIGSISRSGKTFVGDLIYSRYRRQYRLMIRAYDYMEDVRDELDITPVNGSVVVMSILSEGKEEYVHMPVTKASDFVTPFPCRHKK